jgi:alkylated DNA repair dioxygenase AlkB
MCQTLIPVLAGLPGFEYCDDIIAGKDYEDLLAQLMQLVFVPHEMFGRFTLRKMCCFGWNYDIRTGELMRTPGPLPGCLLPLRELCAAKAGVTASDFEQAIVTLYDQKNAGIGAHIDAPKVFGPVVMGVSLGSAVKMVFERDRSRHTITLKPGSLYVMKGEARQDWTHKIDSTPNPPRLSVVFRSLAPVIL